MRVLALDSSANACSVALWRDGVIKASRFHQMERGQSEALLPMVAEVMAEAGASGGDLDVLGVTVGPGAFTGIRIGLAAARGLALTWGIEVAGISSLQAVAGGVPASERAGRQLVVIMDTKRADLWVQVFDEGLVPQGPPGSKTRDEIPALLASLNRPLLAGDAAADVGGADFASAAPYVDARVVAELAAWAWRNGAALPPDPLYLRPADVTLPKTQDAAH